MNSPTVVQSIRQPGKRGASGWSPHRQWNEDSCERLGHLEKEKKPEVSRDLLELRSNWGNRYEPEEDSDELERCPFVCPLLETPLPDELETSAQRVYR